MMGHETGDILGGDLERSGSLVALLRLYTFGVSCDEVLDVTRMLIC